MKTQTIVTIVTPQQQFVAASKLQVRVKSFAVVSDLTGASPGHPCPFRRNNRSASRSSTRPHERRSSSSSSRFLSIFLLSRSVGILVLMNTSNPSPSSTANRDEFKQFVSLWLSELLPGSLSPRGTRSRSRNSRMRLVASCWLRTLMLNKAMGRGLASSFPSGSWVTTTPRLKVSGGVGSMCSRSARFLSASLRMA